MPRAPLRECSFRGCRTLIDLDLSRCAAHSGRTPGRRPAYEQLRGKSYGPRWPAIRALVLRQEPRCRHCGAPSTEVDHIRGRTSTRSNLQALCSACHRAKTTAAANAGRRHA